MRKDINEKIQEYIRFGPEVKATIHWWELYEGHRVKLETNFQKELFEKAIRKASCFSCLGRKLSISRRTIAECSKGKRSPRIADLIKVANFINFPKLKIENKIVNLGRGFFKPKLPFKLYGVEGAEIRAAFLSDGHVPSEPTQCPVYCAYEKELHLSLIEACKSVFGDFIANIYQGHKSLQTRFPTGIGTALELAGVPRGDKRVVKHSVPKDVMLGLEDIKCAYLRRVFDDEGDVCFDKYGKRAVRITRSSAIEKSLCSDITKGKWTRSQIEIFPSRLILGEQLLLQSLRIDARMYSEGIYRSTNNQLTAKWRIQIGQQDALKLFANKIGFSLAEKQNKLQQAINSYRVRQRANGEGKKNMLKIAMLRHKEQGYFNYADLGKELLKQGFSYDLAKYYINDFIKTNTIERLGRGKYVITENAFN